MAIRIMHAITTAAANDATAQQGVWWIGWVRIAGVGITLVANTEAVQRCLQLSRVAEPGGEGRGWRRKGEFVFTQVDSEASCGGRRAIGVISGAGKLRRSELGGFGGSRGRVGVHTVREFKQG